MNKSGDSSPPLFGEKIKPSSSTLENGLKGKKPNKRTMARLAAIQALYQLEITGVGLETIMKEFEDHRLGGWIDENKLLPADKLFFQDILKGVRREQKLLDQAIHLQLTSDWPIARLDSTLRALLRASAFELYLRMDVPTKVVINEYIEIADTFFENSEVNGFVNAVLDKLAKLWREEKSA